MTTTSARAIAPTTTGTLPTIPRYITTIESALRAILAEVTPYQRPYSGDSYLPDHLVKAAQAALDGTDLAASQSAHNALSTAAWHIARGEPAKALARMRRAKSHITAMMETSVTTTNGRA